MLRGFVVFAIGISGALATAYAQTAVKPLGELGARIELVHERLLRGTMPAFTDDFILADVELRPEYPRRFAEFSGDISGRYLGAMALLPPENGPDLLALAKKIIACQRADGRFGSDKLNFTKEEVGREHMALLWGNGRLLAGLMELYSVNSEPVVLESARRLGQFVLSVQEACSDPAVAERLRDQAANGYICFTQLIEGLVMLHVATGEPAFLEGAEQIAAWFQRPLAAQHTHGYLTTLRGFMLLHDVMKKPEYLQRTEEAFNEIIASPNYLIFGGMPEYFTNPNKRDEGCSIADFLRLALQLWRVTGKMEHLETAERCLLNHFYGDQFNNGDFGHNFLSDQGMVPGNGMGRAWWCCTMHGLRAFRDVLDAVATQNGDAVRINLFLDAQWRGDGLALSLMTRPQGLRVLVDAAAANETTLAIRRPSWAGEMSVALNGQPVDAREQNGYLEVRRVWSAGDTVEVTLTYNARLLTRDGKVLAPAELTDSFTEAALFYGPWLLGIDSAYDPAFHGEPWSGNEVFLPAALTAALEPADDALSLPQARIPVTYRHEGFPDPCQATLRPFSERTRHEQSVFSVWLRFRKG